MLSKISAGNSLNIFLFLQYKFWHKFQAYFLLRKQFALDLKIIFWDKKKKKKNSYLLNLPRYKG